MSVIDDYLEKYDDPERAELEKIRSIVKAIVPDAEEVMTYGMPGFKYNGKYLIAFSVFKDHLGLFPASGPVEAHKDKLVNFKTSKGGIQFTPQKPIPESLIREILLTRLAEMKQQR
jgi:uncharacterized protein YdhG (YjbR/CyaY superfamily)